MIQRTRHRHQQTSPRSVESLEPRHMMTGDDSWAFVETFDGDPPRPSQTLLPDRFDYSVTHRTHPRDHFSDLSPFPADHGSDCAGPNPDVTPLPQHDVTTSNRSNGTNPDQSFFVCKNHMMSSMGEVSGYSIASFWPRQEFNFEDGGVLEFDVNINDGHPRVWWEIMITPRAQLRPNAATLHTPISERYSPDHVVLQFSQSGQRRIYVGADVEQPEGQIVNARHWATWRFRHADDPALEDRRIRRTMRVEIENERISWSILDQHGKWDTYSADVPGGLPFQQGLVVFKHHAYTPEKDDNFDNYTFHWDNIRFTGPDLGTYAMHEASDTIYLQANGNRPIGERARTTITLPDEIGANPVLFGQTNNGMPGQVLVSINDGPLSAIPVSAEAPYGREGWRAFQLPLDPAELQSGDNTVTFEVGPRPDGAVSWAWDGYSIKDLEIQTDPPSTASERPTEPSVPGDANGDALVNAADIDFLFALIRQGDYTEAADLDDNQQVDQADVDVLLKDYLRTRRGDANLDGTVDILDFLQLSRRFGEPGTWSDGDFDGSGTVDLADIGLLILGLLTSQ